VYGVPDVVASQALVRGPLPPGRRTACAVIQPHGRVSISWLNVFPMASTLDVSVHDFIAASPVRVRAVMFDPLQDPTWMAAVRTVEPVSAALAPGARVRRTGRFLGRTLRWTTEVVGLTGDRLDLRIVDGPMRGTVAYTIEAEGGGARVTIRNVGEAPGFAPRWLLTWAMRRAWR
ncbi:MAG: SRPBCC family protein, partial [bacterium]